jgi:hypothetical protein
MTEVLYTSRLIKATALIADTKALFASWDLHEDAPTNLNRARETNLLGKASRARAEDVLKIFRQRYFDDPEIGQALVTLIQGNVPASWVDPLLYFYTVQNDNTLRAIVLELIANRRLSGYTDITLEQVLRLLREWVSEGKTTSSWGEDTLLHVGQHALATLRDFGILQGKATKSITPIYLPVESFTFLAFELWRHLQSGEKVLKSPDWNLFFLPAQAVERFFLEAHQERLLSYSAAGSIIRLDFSENSLREVASVLVERANS